MKIADILRHVADQVDREEEQAGEMDPTSRVPHAESDPTTMIPPLQQKIEILKKAAGEANAFDDGVGHSGEHVEPEDELDRIKHIAGLTVMIDGPQGEMG